MAILVAVIFLIGVLLIAFGNNIAEFIVDHSTSMKHLLLYAAAVALVLAAFAFLPPAKAEVDFYPEAAVVVSFNVPEGTILLEDGKGNLFELYWEFEDNEPVEKGDVFSLIMWEAGTPSYKLDDEILDAVNSRIKAQ